MDVLHGVPNPLSQSNLHNQSAQLDESAMVDLVGHPESSIVGESDTHTLIPSRGGTLKKRQSLSKKHSLKRSGSRKNGRPGSVKSLTFANDRHGSEMNSAFFTPVPTTGSPTDILANRFQGRSRYAYYEE